MWVEMDEMKDTSRGRDGGGSVHQQHRCCLHHELHGCSSSVFDHLIGLSKVVVDRYNDEAYTGGGYISEFTGL
jgi:hypothetical protein